VAEVDADLTSCCVWSRCKQTDLAVIWGGGGLCDPHWKKVADMPGLVIDNLKGHVPTRVHKELQRNLGPPKPRSLKSMFGL
jgi:hypothetical protein